jgi:hypothetical protein
MNELIVFLIFICSVFFLVLEKYYHAQISVLFVLLPFLLLISFSKTPDTTNYIQFLNFADNNLFHDHREFGLFGPGFQTLTKIIKNVTGTHFPFYLFIYSSINLVIIISTIKILRGSIAGSLKKAKRFDYLLALVLYFSYFGLYYNAIAIRANYAISLIYFITALIVREKISFTILFFLILLFVLALSFHMTAIIGIFVIFIFWFSHRHSKRIYLSLWFFTGIIYFGRLGSRFANFFIFTLLPAVESKFHISGLAYIIHASDNRMLQSESRIGARFIFLYFTALLLSLPRKKPIYYYKYLNVYYCGLFIAAGFSSAFSGIGRVYDFFIFSQFILLWLFIKEQKVIEMFLRSIIVIIPQVIFVIRIINGYSR